MCGIAGIISRDRNIDHERLQSMAAQLYHRGPEGKGDYKDPDGYAGFAHTRLCIIDRSDSAAQPLQYLDRYHIIHNGELYNYLEIRSLLEKKGHRFRSSSDTEVIVASYAEWGSDCLQYFNGMFAFAIWDEKEKNFFAARDRFGEKPFFYNYTNGELVFGSEMKALWAAGISTEVKEGMVYNFLTIDYTSNPGDPGETFFKNVHKLPAASFLEFSPAKNEPCIEKYWQVYPGDNISISADNAVGEFQQLLGESVRLRMRSDVAVGTSLSGGLDSSSVVALCDKAGSEAYTHKCFTSSFPGFEKDETQFASIVASRFRLDHYLSTIESNDVVRTMDSMMKFQEEPVLSASPLLQFRLYETAKRNGVTVLLDGQGADETLAGYKKYFRWYWQALYRDKKLKKSRELEKARALDNQEAFGWKNKLAAVMPDFAAAMQLSVRARSAARRDDIHPELKSSEKKHFYYTLPPSFDLNSMLHFNTFVYGLEELLRMADRNSMAHATEVRLPFLDHKLVEFLFSLPADIKIRDGWSKWLLRKSVENTIPPEIVWRKDKIGFEPPQKQWMQQPDVQQSIAEAKKLLVEKNVLDKSVLNKKIQPHDAHAAVNNDWKYWSLSFLYKI
jgi:asparagine synthase (glutamine-hydrolysing)